MSVADGRASARARGPGVGLGEHGASNENFFALRRDVGNEGELVAVELQNVAQLLLLVGHAGHPEVVGTIGQLPAGSVLLVETIADVAALPALDDTALAFVTQTTLSVDDTSEIINALRQRFPAIVGPHKEDICYATTNRQEAIKKVALLADAVIVVGSPNSSNSQRLREVAERAGAKKASSCCGQPRSTGQCSRGYGPWRSPPVRRPPKYLSNK